jgi:hypothetical protein
VLADKSILESKDLLSDNRSGSPNIHGLKSWSPLKNGVWPATTPWTLPTNVYENPQYSGVQCRRYMSKFSPEAPSAKFMQAKKRSLSVQAIQEYFPFDKVKKLENKFNSTHAS